MLESAQANETWGRYTFLGFDPKMEIICIDGEMKIGSLKVKTDNPSNYLRQILADGQTALSAEAGNDDLFFHLTSPPRFPVRLP